MSKKRNLIIVLATIGAALILALCTVAVIKMVNKNNSKPYSEAVFAQYDFDEVLIGESGAGAEGGVLNAGTATRHRVVIVENPNEGGEATASSYVTDGGSIKLTTTVNGGYTFLGWYIDGKKVSGEVSYNLTDVHEDITIVAKYDIDLIDVTVIAVGQDYKSGGGTVTGGGTLHANGDDIINLKATPASGYDFLDWSINGHFIGGSSDKLKVKYGTAEYEGGDTYYIKSDTQFQAVFQKNTRTITVSMLPGVGTVAIGSMAPQSVASIQDTSRTSIDFSYNIPNDQVQVYENDKYVSKNRYSFGSLRVYQNGEIVKETDGSKFGNSGSFSGYSIPDSGDVEIIIVLKCTQATDVANFGAIGVAVPTEGGTVSGGGSATISTTFSLDTVANAGYKFDHWEWYDGDTPMSSTNKNLLVKPNGFVTYYAYFLPLSYNVTLASSDPSGGGTVSGLGTVLCDNTGAASASLSIRTTSGYTLDSATYVMNGKNYVLNIPSPTAFGTDQYQYDVDILGITGDVALSLKYKKTSNAKVTLWDDTDIAGNIVGFSSTETSESSVSKSLTGTLPQSINLYAKATSGYKLKQAVVSTGGIIPASSFTTSMSGTDTIYNYTGLSISDNTDVYFQFEAEKYKIKVAVDPVAYGTADIQDSSGTSLGTEYDVEAGNSLKLVATPASDKHFLYWITSAGTKLSGETDSNGINTLTLNNINWSETYTAHFVDSKIEVGVDVAPEDGGTAQLNDEAPVSHYTSYNNINYEDTISLKAVPNKGFRFVRWDIITYTGAAQESKVSYTDPDIQLVYVTKDVDCVAVFAKGKYSIRVQSSPVAGGNATVNDYPDELSVDEGERVVLKAAPNAGYQFDYWTDSAGNRYKDNPYVIESVSGSETFTAHFKSPNITVVIAPSSSEGGTVQLDSNPAQSSSKAYEIKSGSNITLKAVPNSGYRFVRWEAYNEVTGQTTAYGDAVTQIVNLQEDTTFTAVFSAGAYTIKVISSPVNGGMTYVSGKLNSADFMPGESATLEAEPSSGYRFDHWQDSAGNRYTDNPMILDSINGDETYTAFYVSGKIDITVNNMPEGSAFLLVNGKKVSPGYSVQVNSGDNVTLTAEDIDSKKYKFERWESNSGQIYQTNPLQLVNVTKSETYTAVYNLLANERGIIVIASPASGGKVTKTIDKSGSLVYLKAIANRGYRFVSWQMNNRILSYNAECVGNNLEDGTVYKAVFAKDANYDAKSDIVTEHFYNDKRQFTDPYYTVTRESMINEAHERIETEKDRQYANSTPDPKTYIAVEKAKDLYNDLEVLDDRSVLMAEDELFTTDGEVMNLRVIPDNSNEVDAAKEFTEKKYGRRYTCDVLVTKEVTPPLEFIDGIRTYLWKYQDVLFRDNVYILYTTDDGKTDWVSCIIDEGGTLRFTIDKLTSKCTMSIVKVKIE